MRQPGRRMGEAAAELLAEEVRAPDGHEHRTLVLRPELLVRRSTAG